MIRLNLLPDVKLEYLRTKRVQAQVISIATIVTIAAAALVILLALWVFGGQSIQKSYLTGQIKKNSSTLKQKEDIDKYLTIQNQLAHITALHEGKTDYSRLMKYLPILNPTPPNNVTLTNVEVATDDAGNRLLLTGEVKDYTSLTTFRDTLVNAQLSYGEGVSEKLFETVTVASSSLDKSTSGGAIVSFKIETTYNPNAFLSSVKNPTVSVPIKTTTQSAQATPNVFGQSSVKQEDQ